MNVKSFKENLPVSRVYSVKREIVLKVQLINLLIFLVCSRVGIRTVLVVDLQLVAMLSPNDF